MAQTKVFKNNWLTTFGLNKIRPSFEALSDEVLAAKAATGSSRHFEVLVRRYSAAIYRVSFRLLGSSAEAEDVTQETFVKVFKALPKASLNLPFKPWLYKIAVNTAISYYRKSKKISQTSIEEVEIVSVIDVDKTVAARVDAQKAISRLPLKYRQVLVLRAIEDLPFSEISQILQIHEATARTNFKRAKEKLNEFLKY